MMFGAFDGGDSDNEDQDEDQVMQSSPDTSKKDKKKKKKNKSKKRKPEDSVNELLSKVSSNDDLKRVKTDEETKPAKDIIE